MKLTAEQGEAFRRANAACAVIKRGRNCYAIRHPYRAGQPEGAATETAGAWDYLTARRMRAQYAAYHALMLLPGWNSCDADCATADMTGTALEIFKAGLRHDR